MTTMRLSKFPIFLLTTTLVLLLQKAHADGFDFDLEIEAPAEIRTLLRAHLSLSNARGQARTTAEQVKRLVESSNDEARDLLATLGYFSPEIETRYQTEKSTPTAYIRVIPGNPARVRKLTLQLNGVATRSSEAIELKNSMLTAWTLPVGAIYTQSAWAEGKKRVLDPLQNRLYAAASVTHSEARVDPKAAMVDLQVDIESGPAYVFGPLSIRGLKYYPEALAREQSPFKPGDEYRRGDLLDLQTNLQARPHFTLALVDTQLPVEAPFEVPVSIDIQEAPRHRIQTGAGYTTNTGVSGDLGYRFLNIAERGWISETKTHLAESEQSIETSLTFPRTHTDYEHRLYTGLTHTDLQGLDTRTWRTGITRELGDFKLSRLWGLEYQKERRVLNDGTINYPQTLAVKFQWIKHALDSQRNPRSGNMLQLDSAAAIASMVTDETFVRLYGRYAGYWPIGKQSVVLARAELGHTFARDETAVPTDWLFRTGGSNSVRGYDYQSIGITQNGSITPGRVMAVGSVEAQIHVWDQWRAAFFVDTGDAALRWAEIDRKTGVGTGARWVSPVGVLGTDFAYGLAKREWRFHLALGLSF